MKNLNLSMNLKDGRQLGFAEFGDHQGTPIFFFHGFPGSRLEAEHMHECAVANHYRLIAIDRPGMGLSAINKNRTILSWVNDIVEFSDYLHIGKFSIVGHSGGAPFVAACAYAIPERLNGAAIVSGLAPLEKPEAQQSITHGQKVVYRIINKIPGITLLMMQLTKLMLKNSNKMMSQIIKQLPEPDRVFFQDPVSANIIINGALEAFRNGIAGPAYEMKLFFKPWGFDLEEINFPISIWQGALDTQAPVALAKLLAKLIPNSQLELRQNEGHHSLIRNHRDEILRRVCA